MRGPKDLAIADYSKAIELNPNNADAYIGRGQVYSFTGYNDQAIADYDMAIMLNRILNRFIGAL